MNTTGSNGTIDHEGIVQRNSGNSVTISIMVNSACSGCHTESSCMLSKSENKIIEVAGSYNFRPGDEVTILMEPSTGFAAIFYGYVLPVISIMICLIVMISAGVPELFSGLISL
ncbi:MAG: SoxR reducing system RseC family protein, partial [Methanococcaceae archaeon]